MGSNGFDIIGTLNLTANLDIEYKYISKYNGQITWESDPNRVYHTPPGGQVTLNDVWR
jgi:glucoamylase